MAKINVLDIDTVNKIAAGEVVERPASAIKELIENAVDSGADFITVEIKNGGSTFMRVTDNGCGIAADEAELAFLPHSTSKIKNIEDLQSLYTMGFRGEALASIASVSRVDIITRAKGADFGISMTLEGGKVVSKSEIGCPEGTTIVVRDLFYNTPARLGFLKKDTTEAAHISDVVGKMILGNPDISFKYISGGREVMFSPGGGNISDAFAAVYGREAARSCTEVCYDLNGIHVEGLAGLPAYARVNRNMQNFYVNGRAVRSKTIMFAAEQAYRTMLMTGKFPVLLLNLKVNSASVDVNVHPQKLEIKFSNEKSVHDAVFWAVQSAILKSDKEKSVGGFHEEAPRAEFSTKPIFVREDAPAPKPAERKFTSPEPKKKVDVSDFFTKEIIDIFKAPEPVFEKTQSDEENMLKEPEQESFTDNTAEKQVLYKIIGQVFDTYIIAESEGKMLLIDQHAAHERINYNRLVKERGVKSQLLMFPETVALSATEADVAKSNADIFSKLGFEMEDFGANKFIVRQAPSEIEAASVGDTVTEIVSLIAENKDPDTIYDHAMFTIACKSAIKANHKLTAPEIDEIVYKVLNDESVRTCPHGRPVVISFDKKFIEKEFKRIV